MGKEDLMARYRLDGMEFALRIAKEKGIDGLEEELRWRNKQGIGIPVTQAELDLAGNRMKAAIFSTVTTLYFAATRDEYGFGRKRLNRIANRFNSKAECIGDGYASWQDYADLIFEETGIRVEIDQMTKGIIVKIDDGKKR